jgi:organic hydroperoxide reductase OsmC/OhrA
VEYVDDPTGTMVETDWTGGHFTEVVLRPTVTLRAEADVDLAIRLHDRAHALCFIASSVRFPVRCEPTVRIDEARP